MKKGYGDHLIREINSYPFGVPIRTVELTERLSAASGIPRVKARQAVNLTMKRILDRGKDASLRRFAKGIYYRAKVTPFGVTGIDLGRVIAAEYLEGDSGYETGPAMLNKLGLTSAMPRIRHIASNKVTGTTRSLPRLGVVVRQPRTPVNSQNKRYLQLLDVVDSLDTAPVDASEPNKILVDFVHTYRLDYKHLLALAKQFYSQRVVLKLAELAAEECKT